MKKLFFLLSVLILIPYSLLNAEQGYYFNRSLDSYEKNIVPPFIPSNAQRSYLDNLKFPVNSQLEYKWQIKMPKVPEDDSCKATMIYYRITPQHAKYNFSINGINVKTGTYLDMLFKDSCGNEVVEVSQNFVKNHLDYIKREYCGNYQAVKQKEIAQKIINENPKIPSVNYFLLSHQYNNRYRGVFIGNYENMIFYLKIGDCLRSPEVIEHVKRYGFVVMNKLTGGNISVEQPVEKPKEAYKEQPKEESPKVRVIAMPSAAGDDLWSIAYLPATNKLPAKIIAETKPNTPVTFHIVKSPNDAYLVVGDKKGVTIETKSDSKGIAEALFYYNGGKVTQPKKYEIKVSTGEERDIATVNVGLGLAFDKIKAVQGAYGDRHPFTLSLVSKYFPKLNLGLYFSSASRKVWNGQTVGVRLKPQWVNKTPDLPADMVFNGITKITPVMASSGGNNVLTVLSYDSGEETVYNITKYAYPALKMMSEGVHNYRIVGELVLTDEEGRDLGGIDEKLIQSDALAVVSKEMPEHYMVSLVCVFETQSADQFVMLDFIKRFPVYGKYADEFLNITGMLCKLGKADYEGLFYDLNNYLGGKWLDHLTSPKVFEKLTPRQQKAVKWAKATFDATQKVKTKKEYDDWEVQSPARRSVQSLNPDHDAKKLEFNRELVAPSLIDLKEAEEALQKMEEKEQKNKPIEAKFNNENLKKADEMKQQQNTQTQNTEGNVLEKAVNELKDVFKKIFK